MAPCPSTSVISYLPRWRGVVIRGRIRRIGSPLEVRAGIFCFFQTHRGKRMPLRAGLDLDHFNRFGNDYSPGLPGLVITEKSEGVVKGELPVRKALLAPNGYLHAGTIVTFA